MAAQGWVTSIGHHTTAATRMHTCLLLHLEHQREEGAVPVLPEQHAPAVAGDAGPGLARIAARKAAQGHGEDARGRSLELLAASAYRARNASCCTAMASGMMMLMFCPTASAKPKRRSNPGDVAVMMPSRLMATSACRSTATTAPPSSEHLPTNRRPAVSSLISLTSRCIENTVPSLCTAGTVRPVVRRWTQRHCVALGKPSRARAPRACRA